MKEKKEKKIMVRRHFLKTGLVSAGVGLMSAKAASRVCGLGETPGQPEGPFYPETMPLDRDADLTYVKERKLKATGEVIYIEGVVVDQHCTPVDGAVIEIWQACATGKYNHSGDPNPAVLDPNFQYYGRAVTESNGSYRFKTIRPGAYPAGSDWVRPPHIHFKISRRGHRELTTQMYFADHAELNAGDLILQDLALDDQSQVVIVGKESGPSGEAIYEFEIELHKLR